MRARVISQPRLTTRERLICGSFAAALPIAAGICVYLFGLHPALMISAMMFGIAIGVTSSKRMLTKRR